MRLPVSLLKPAMIPCDGLPGNLRNVNLSSLSESVALSEIIKGLFWSADTLTPVAIGAWLAPTLPLLILLLLFSLLGVGT